MGKDYCNNIHMVGFMRNAWLFGAMCDPAGFSFGLLLLPTKNVYYKE